MMVMSDRKIQTNKVCLASTCRSKTVRFKSLKHEAFHSLTVAVFCRGDYLKCHTLMGVNNTI